MRSDVNDGILFYTPFTHEKNACISTSGSMIYHYLSVVLSPNKIRM